MNLQKEISIITVETVVFTKKTFQSCFQRCFRVDITLQKRTMSNKF